tara:strand:+ start:142 stop:942 length:801 start_codon:yes stop_codon:yes gene_type:complete
MLDLTKNYCYDPILQRQLDIITMQAGLHNVPEKDLVLMELCNYHQCYINTLSVGFGTIDIVDKLLSLFKGKTLTCIGPYWAGIHWACEKNGVKVSEDGGDIAYIARPNGRDGLVRDVPFDDYEFVIIDEAYSDFADETLINHVHTNSIVTKTFSKSLSMPGVRFAYAVSSPEMASRLNKLHHPYSINGLVQVMVPRCFELIQQHVIRMLQTKEYLEKNYECLPSQANFVRMVNPPPFDVKVTKIDNYYRFTLIELRELFKLEIQYN